MPAKNAIKNYLPDSFYHLYNRGVEKRNIFLDNQDFAVFISYLKTYLLPKDRELLQTTLTYSVSSYAEKEKAHKLLMLKNFAGEIELHAYALLPNHFHLLIKQISENSMNQFVQSLLVRYSGYFNRKYKRVGKLFQGVYKAVLVNSDEQLLHLSRYIHLNPLIWTSLPVARWNETNLPSSMQDYLFPKNGFVHTEQILSYFKKTSPSEDYFHFINSYADPEIIVPVSLDFED